MRMAGEDAPFLPLMLAATGQIPGLSPGQRAQAARELKEREQALAAAAPALIPGRDPRDVYVGDGMWATSFLPLGITIEEAIANGTWLGRVV